MPATTLTSVYTTEGFSFIDSPVKNKYNNIFAVLFCLFLIFLKSSLIFFFLKIHYISNTLCMNMRNSKREVLVCDFFFPLFFNDFIYLFNVDYEYFVLFSGAAWRCLFHAQMEKWKQLIWKFVITYLFRKTAKTWRLSQCLHSVEYSCRFF